MSNPSLDQLRKRTIEQLAEAAMTALVISGKHTSPKWTSENAYDLAEAMQGERERRYGPLTPADL